MSSAQKKTPVDYYKATTLADFELRAEMLLTESERNFVYSALGQYEKFSDIETLVRKVLTTLDTPVKLDLLKDIRQFVEKPQRVVFDMMVPYRQMAHPWRAADTRELSKSGSEKSVIGKNNTSSLTKAKHKDAITTGMDLFW